MGIDKRQNGSTLNGQFHTPLVLNIFKAFYGSGPPAPAAWGEALCVTIITCWTAWRVLHGGCRFGLFLINEPSTFTTLAKTDVTFMKTQCLRFAINSFFSTHAAICVTPLQWPMCTIPEGGHNNLWHPENRYVHLYPAIRECARDDCSWCHTEPL